MRAKFRFLGDEFDIAPLERGDPLTMAVNDRRIVIEAHDLDEGRQRFIVDHHEHSAYVVRDGDDIFIHLDGDVWEVQAIDPIDAAGTGVRGSDAVLAPMPGVVVSIAVAVGQTVIAGHTLIVIESMKLQTSIVAERDGVIAEVFFQQDQTFDKGAELMRFESMIEDSAG